MENSINEDDIFVAQKLFRNTYNARKQAVLANMACWATAETINEAIERYGDPLLHQEWEMRDKRSAALHRRAIGQDRLLMQHIHERYPVDPYRSSAYFPFNIVTGSTYPTTACKVNEEVTRAGGPAREYMGDICSPSYPLNLLWFASTAWPVLQDIEKTRLLEVLSGWVCAAAFVPKRISRISLAGEVHFKLVNESFPDYFKSIRVASLSDCFDAEETASRISEEMFEWSKRWARQAVAPLLRASDETLVAEIEGLKVETQLKLFEAIGARPWEGETSDMERRREMLAKVTARWTPTERQVMSMRADGLSYTQIGQKLSIPVWDVQKHIQRARAEAVSAREELHNPGSKSIRARRKK